MNQKEKRVIMLTFALLAVLSVLGIVNIRQKSSPSSLAMLAARGEDFSTFDFSGGDLANVTIDDDTLYINWEATSSGSIDIASQPMPLFVGDGVQVDLAIGGQQNTFNSETKNYQVVFRVELMQNGVQVAMKNAPVPLASDKSRQRLYSIALSCGNAKPDAYRIHLIVQQLNGIVKEGTLTCSQLIIWNR